MTRYHLNYDKVPLIECDQNAYIKWMNKAFVFQRKWSVIKSAHLRHKICTSVSLHICTIPIITMVVHWVLVCRQMWHCIVLALHHNCPAVPTRASPMYWMHEASVPVWTRSPINVLQTYKSIITPVVLQLASIVRYCYRWWMPVLCPNRPDWEMCRRQCAQ